MLGFMWTWGPCLCNSLQHQRQEEMMVLKVVWLFIFIFFGVLTIWMSRNWFNKAQHKQITRLSACQFSSWMEGKCKRHLTCRSCSPLWPPRPEGRWAGGSGRGSSEGGEYTPAGRRWEWKSGWRARSGWTSPGPGRSSCRSGGGEKKHERSGTWVSLLSRMWLKEFQESQPGFSVSKAETGQRTLQVMNRNERCCMSPGRPIMLIIVIANKKVFFTSRHSWLRTTINIKAKDLLLCFYCIVHMCAKTKKTF